MSRIVGQLEKFFTPRSVAVIGASSTPGKIGYEVLKNLSQYEYKGRVYPINPSQKKILGLKCYHDISDVPDKVDLAILIVPSRIVAGVLESCGKAGIRNVIIISGGFKEMGGEFARIEAEMKEIGHRYSIRIVGPNCIGVFDSESKLDTFFQPRRRMLRPSPGPVALMTQSGAYGLTIVEWIAESNFGISKFVSYGNRVDVDEADLLRYFDADPKTRIISIYVEGLGDGRKFLQSAREVSSHKPVVILKAGNTDLGSEGALSHTGSLAGSYEVYKAAFKQASLIVAESLTELYDMTKALAMQPPAKGRNVAMTSNGMGPCIAALDQCQQKNIEVGNYSQKTVKSLQEILPPYCIVKKVVDLSGSATKEDYAKTLQAFMKDENIDLAMPFFMFQDAPLEKDVISVFPELVKYRKPIICTASGGPYTRKLTRIIEQQGIPVYPTGERAVSAAYALMRAGEILQPGKGD